MIFRTTQIAYTSLALAAFGLAARGEINSRGGVVGQNPTTGSATVETLGAAHKSSDLFGLPVENESAAVLGQLEDLAVDTSTGKILHVIVGSGGFLSNAKYIAVPPSEVRADLTHKIAFLDVTEAKLKAAPRFDAAHWDEFYQSDRWREAARFFETSDSPRDQQASVQRASKVIGLPVKNSQDEHIGSVRDLMVDLLHNRVVAVVVSSGGFLGLGESLSAVPLPVLKLDKGQAQFRTAITKEDIKKSSNFTAGTWPDFTVPLYVESVYRAYHLEVKPASDVRAFDVNNTAVNVRERDHRSLTPFDQSEAPNDLRITQEIRKALIDAKNLSLTAQNVKIITMDGRVLLRGPVRSPEEKRIVGDIASHLVFGGNVENQLEVIQGTSSL